ncbi:MAG: DnaJ domain-containing protein, partial [Candidatus Limnocylindrales bacterium]
MAPQVDPYRTLGLDRGASLAEVKGAYRRLAKANHPDRAGEGALPRFLAIQAAYDQIAGPDGGARRTSQGSSATGSAGGAARPWDADPDRADATHRAYGGRPRR